MMRIARNLQVETHGNTCWPLSVVNMFSMVGKRKNTSGNDDAVTVE